MVKADVTNEKTAVSTLESGNLRIVATVLTTPWPQKIWEQHSIEENFPLLESTSSKLPAVISFVCTYRDIEQSTLRRSVCFKVVDD
jgi:hypothetical protein